MIIDEIRKANLQAMKERNINKKNIMSLVIARYTALKTDGSNREITDNDVISLLMKIKKELEEERDGYLKADREEQAKAISEQIENIEPFLPKMLSEEEIKNIISSLEDKSIPSVMKHFKANYAGQVDMSLVNKVLRGV